MPSSLMLPSRHFLSLRLWLGLLAWCAIGAIASAADLPFLSPAFGDHMVLQRDQPNRIWGWTEPGQSVTVALADHSATATAGADGRWQVALTPPPAGGPYTLTVSGPTTVELSDVLVGDVWLCAGQSNMEFGLNHVNHADAEIAAANFPQIREFRVPAQSAYASKLTLPAAAWEVCSPATAGHFSAIAYLFGRRLHEELGVPIGLVRDAVGGTGIECWLSPQALAHFPEFKPELAEMDRLRGHVKTEYGSFLMHWLDDYDIGQDPAAPWQSPTLDDSAWTTVNVPDGFTTLGLADQPGVAWFRRTVELPDPLPAGPTRLLLGQIDRMDTTFVNGTWIGASSWVENPRRYTIDPKLLHPGHNVIAIRIFKKGAGGGFPSAPDLPRLELGDGTVILLRGPWQGRVSVDARPPHPLPLGFENYTTMPTVLHHGMIQPLLPLTLRGVVWYQGEANFTRSAQYRGLLPALIQDWRRLFQAPELPVYIVGLPAFMARHAEPGTDGWTELREAQWLATQTEPHTALAVTVDTGDANNIHPQDKQPVADRVARCALGDTYGRAIAYQGPTYRSADVQTNGSLRVHFDHAEGGLVVKATAEQPTPGEFALAGADGVWHWAEATVDGATIVVRSANVRHPVAVSYAWQANPVANVYNQAGLPAVPFRQTLSTAATASR